MVENGQSDRLAQDQVLLGFRYLAWGTCFLLMTADIMPYARYCPLPAAHPE